MFFDHKIYWNSKLKYALWDDRISIKKYIGTYPFQLVYGADVNFPMILITMKEEIH